MQSSCRQDISIDEQDSEEEPKHSKPQHIKCLLCNCIFVYHHSMLQHMKKHHAGLFIICKHNGRCSQVFLTEAQKAKHILELTNSDKLKKCDFCQIMYNKESGKSHFKMHHKNDNLIRCSYSTCSSYFRSAAEKQNHEALVHAIKEKRKCIFCKLFFSDHSMLQHFHNKHKSLFPSAFKCKFHCVRYFLTEAELKIHVASVHGTYFMRSEVQCIYCNKICIDKYVLCCHINRNHSVVKIQCKIRGCNQYFLTQTQADEHFEQQHQKIEDNKIFKCLKCNYGSANRGLLKLHISRKHGDKILPCSKCTKHYRCSRALAIHIKSAHSSPKACPHCKSSNLLNMRMHLKQEKCKRCQKVLLCVRSAQMHKKLCKSQTSPVNSALT